MRPLRLALKGFTSFRDPAELDFTDLDVFAIAGATGSGKSSLLDAMTYALYGRVERVGERVSHLISQGQPRMAVTLEFEVGQTRYRVTRSTPVKGATKIMLERQDPGGEWTQAGDGADRVRDAERMIAHAIGLTYDGFTRSVLLPQGKFAEFLVGDARKRRDILTELLGLSLFRRMAERAGALARESAIRAQERTQMLEHEYADATPEALREAKRAAEDAVAKEQALAGAAGRVLGILGRWQEAKRSVDELEAWAGQALRAAEGASAAAEELAELAERSRRAVRTVKKLSAACVAAQEGLAEGQRALRQAERTSGLATDLARAEVRAHALAEAITAREVTAAGMTAAEEMAVALAVALDSAERASSRCKEVLGARESEALIAETALKHAQDEDHVAALVAGRRAGDPCPVCGVALTKLPKRPAAGAQQKAAKVLASARSALEAARKDLAEAERAVDGAHRDLEANAFQRARLAAEAGTTDRAIADHGVALEAVLGSPLPPDPLAALEERLAELQALDRAERDASRKAVEAAQALGRAEQHRDGVASLIDRLRDRLAADHRPLFDFAARAMGAERSPAATLSPPPEAGEPDLLKRFAKELAQSLASLASQLGREVQERSSLQGRLLDEATGVVEGLVEPAESLEALAETIDRACRTAGAAVGSSGQRAKALAERLQRRTDLTGEARLLEARARLFRQLATELRADRLIAFLQAEALQVLAAAGSDRLASLSDGRYRIVCRDDEFLVVDTWNGDDERSVRTLSGGETFLASLALALALSDQVRSLSVTDRARLDSLFLDEGFGTLDPESLRVVVEALEQLGGDGRLVGIITHVRDLSEQFPRIEIAKSPRGSTARFVA